MLFFTLGFKQKQFIYFSIDNFHKLVIEDDTRNATKVVVTISLIFSLPELLRKKAKYFGTIEKFGYETTKFLYLIRD